VGIHDPKHLAIALTAIGLKFGNDYCYLDTEVYMLQAVDGTDFIVKDGVTKQVFSDAYSAAEMFANIVWRKLT
jgi:hypothetical protein